MILRARLLRPGVPSKSVESGRSPDLLMEKVAEPAQKPSPAKGALQPHPLARRSIVPPGRPRLRHDLVAEPHAAVADVDVAGTRNELSNLVLTLSTEGAMTRLPSRHGRSIGTVGCPGAAALSPSARGSCR